MRLNLEKAKGFKFEFHQQRHLKNSAAKKSVYRPKESEYRFFWLLILWAMGKDFLKINNPRCMFILMVQ